MNESLIIPKHKIAEFCQGHHIRRLAVFGSALRDDFTPQSDVDILVEFAPGHEPGLMALAGMERGLSEILGRQVDMVERQAVEASENYIRRRHILKTVESVYVAR